MSERRAVVLIDDDTDVREAVADTLLDEGYAVEAFASGELALDHLRKGADVALVLLDWMMPGMDGGQTLEELRKVPHLAAVPVFLLSADARVSEKATSAGAQGFLRKPVMIDDLLGVVKTYAST